MKKLLSILIAIFVIFSGYSTENILFEPTKVNQSKLDFTDISQGVEIPLSFDNWSIELQPSLSSELAKNRSKIKILNNCLQVRLFTGKFEKTSALLIPPVPLAFSKENEGLGKVSNVADIKSIKIDLYGFGYNINVKLHLRRGNGKIFIIDMGNISEKDTFDISRIINNPSYIEDVKNKKVLSTPIYPFADHSLYLEAIEIHTNKKSQYEEVYLGIGNISIIYDDAILETESSIDYDKIWSLDSNKLFKMKEDAYKLWQERSKYLEKLESLKDHTNEEKIDISKNIEVAS